MVLNVEEILHALQILVGPDEIAEVRIPKPKARAQVRYGYFNDLERMARTVAAESGKAEGVYFTPNPPARSLLARRANRVDWAGKGESTTSDDLITRRRRFFVDIDPQRPAGISSTDQEKQAALKKAEALTDFLTNLGWPAPLLIDSGNGYHLYWRIDLPNDKDRTRLIEHALLALAQMFDDEQAHVDRTVYNAARIMKIPGTMACKGDPLPERPHRLSRIVTEPAELHPLTQSQLEGLAGMYVAPQRPAAQNHSSRLGQSGKPVDLDQFVRANGLGVARERAKSYGRVLVLDVCPFNPAHDDAAAVLMQFDNGAVAFRCQHNGCTGKTWQDLRALYQWPVSRNNSRQLDQVPARRNGAEDAHEDAQIAEDAHINLDEHLRKDEHLRRAETVGLTLLSNVKPVRVRWLWPGRVALGKLAICDGNPGQGKSSIWSDIAARVSRGLAMPDGSMGDLDGPAGAVIASAEDALNDTIKPRLDAGGADCSRIVALTHITTQNGERLPTLADLAAIETAIDSVAARLVLIDPFMAYLPRDVNAFRDQDVRGALAPLAQLAERKEVAIVVIRHLNKSNSSDPLTRGGGSIGIIGAVRTGLLVAPDPEDETGKRRILAVTKSNLAAIAPAMAYHLEEAANGAVRVVWEGTTNHTATSLLAASGDTEGRNALTEAVDFLRELLASGPVASKQVFMESQRAGVKYGTLRRAKDQLGIKPRKNGFNVDSDWVWSLPAEDAHEDAQDREDAHHFKHEHLRDLEHLRAPQIVLKPTWLPGEPANDDSAPGGQQLSTATGCPRCSDAAGGAPGVSCPSCSAITDPDGTFDLPAAFWCGYCKIRNADWSRGKGFISHKTCEDQMIA